MERSPGLWLSLETLLALPMEPEPRAALWRQLLDQLEREDTGDAEQEITRFALQFSLVNEELDQVVRCFELGAWAQGRTLLSSILLGYQRLLQVRPHQSEAIDEQIGQRLIQLLAQLDQALTHGKGVVPDSPADLSDLHWLAFELLEQINRMGVPLPDWYGVVEEGLVRRGGLAMLALEAPEARHRSLRLLLRLAELHEPPPEWIPQRVSTLLDDLVDHLLEGSMVEPHGLRRLLESCGRLAALANEQADQAAIAAALERARLSLDLDLNAAMETAAAAPGPAVLVAPEDIRRMVAHWLDDTPAGPKPVELGLVWVPGARVVPHRSGRIELNLAAVAQGVEESGRVDQAVEAFFGPLQEAGRGADLVLRQPQCSLLESLGYLWGSGGALAAGDCSLLARAMGVWNRCGGPGALGARLQPSSFVAARFGVGTSVLQPSAVQLAALRSWLFQRAELEDVLREIRRQHHNPAFMTLRRAESWLDPCDPLDNLCRLHREEGFYATGVDPLASLKAWAEPALAALAEAQLLMDPEEAGGGWFAVLHGLAQERGRLPEVVSCPGEEAFYRLLAGQEVVLVSPRAAEVETQHRSGRAFDLFTDLPISPYGLRCLRGPDSLYPQRPDLGFEASLAGCLEQLEALASQRPFTVFLTACGVYDLPLCRAMAERGGVSCVSIGPALHARFGLEDPLTEGWRLDQRRLENWVGAKALTAVP